jgi:hypothetical protein
MKALASATLSSVVGAARLGAKALGLAAMKLEIFRFLRLELELRPEDVIVYTYPRSGTTWLQMMLYQLTTDGNMNFSHISERTPWLERQGATHPILKSRQPGRRIFKSHLSLSSAPRGPARRIYVYRDGQDVAVSYYHFFRTQLGFRGTFEDFFPKFMRGDVPYGSWFKHTSEWLTQGDDGRTLFLRYEDIKADLPQCARQVAAFCQIPTNEEIMTRVAERCDFRFMKANQHKFNHFSEILWERGIQPEEFIRNGEVGSGKKTLTAEHQEAFDAALQRWQLEKTLTEKAESTLASRASSAA